MKYTLASAAIVFATTAAYATSNTPPPPPLTPSGRYLWQGELFVTSTEGPCVHVGDSRRVVFEPGGWPYNGSTDKHLFSKGLVAAQMTPVSGNKLIGIKNTNVNLTYIDRAGLHKATEFVIAFTVSNLPAPPVGTSTIAVGSSTVNMSIKATWGCTYTLSGALTGPF